MKMFWRIFRWIFGLGCFGMTAIGALLNGWFLTALCLTIATLLFLPWKPIVTFLSKIKINQVLAIILSAVIFLTGAMLAPSTDADDLETDTTTSVTTITTSNSSQSDTTSSQITTTTTKKTTTTKVTITKQTTTTKRTTTTKITTTTKKTSAGEVLVWIPTKGGKKYHSSSTCSNMDSPIQVTKEEAIAQDFEPCKKCYG